MNKSEKITLKNMAIEHDYYASSSNYYSKESTLDYETWADFYEEYHDSDIDMNLVYRWDIRLTDEGDGYYMQIVIIGQRKGLYIPIQIGVVEEKDVDQIKEFLKPHFEKLVSIWRPISSEYKSSPNIEEERG